MTSHDAKESYRPALMVLVQMHGQEMSALPRAVKEAIREAMLGHQADEDKPHANEYFDLVFYSDGATNG
jgi:hypothetical protein